MGNGLGRKPATEAQGPTKKGEEVFAELTLNVLSLTQPGEANAAAVIPARAGGYRMFRAGIEV